MLELIPNKRFEVMTRDDRRDFIASVEADLLKLPQVDLPVDHHFSHGVYGREMPIPAGTLITGKIHRNATLNVLTKGEVTVVSIEGVVRLKAPHTFVSVPGTKRIIFAHVDSSWLTAHHTFDTDVATIEEQVIAKDYAELEEKCLGLSQVP